MRKRHPVQGQASLFDERGPQAARQEKPQKEPPTASPPQARKWVMPDVQGRTVAEIRLRWLKRLTPAQVARVETELSHLPRLLTKLGYGTVEVEHTFVRRHKK